MPLSKNKIFYLFIVINALCWSLVQFLRNLISVDAMEAVTWGELLSFGTNKHPPLSGWIMAGAYNITGCDFVAYFLGTACIAAGLIFIYKLAKFFLSEEKAFCAAMILSINYYYTFSLFIDNFNCNFLSIALFPMIAYFYYKSIKGNKTSDWLLFGITSGLATITKYQVVFLFLALFLHLILFERKQFKQKGMYIAILAGTIVIMPHLIWLIKNDFFSFAYMTSQASGTTEETQNVTLIKRIFFPIKFSADQLLAVMPCIGIYLLTAFQAKNISFNKTEENISDKCFLLFICLVPIFAQGLMGLFTGNLVHGIWGSIMVSFTGIVLFYFLPVNFNEKTFSFFAKCLYIAMVLWLCAIAIFSQLQTKRHVSYPYQKIQKDIDDIWMEKTNNAPLKYVTGNIGYSSQFRIYDPNKPTVILETFGHKNPWADYEDIEKSGIIVVDKDPVALISRTKQTLIFLNDNYEIIPQKYDYKVTNKLGKTKEYELYYVIIPPKNNGSK